MRKDSSEYDPDTQKFLIQRYTHPKHKNRLREHAGYARSAKAEHKLLPQTIAALRSRLIEPTLQDTTAFLNRIFEATVPAHHVLSEIQRLPSPIAVDFKGVLANNSEPLQPNPEAPSFLSALREIGSVFVVTRDQDWNTTQDFLQQNGMWDTDMVLMTLWSFNFIEGLDRSDPDRSVGKKLWSEYLKTQKDAPSKIPLTEWTRGHKRIAPLFGKSKAVPIVDDTERVTCNNYGMLGILVDHFYPANKKGEKKEETTDRHSLTEAVKIIRDHYTNL